MLASTRPNSLNAELAKGAESEPFLCVLRALHV